MILHSLTHIESVAVDLAWDAIARFGVEGIGYQLPRAFFDDFVAVAEDEARHFGLLAERLKVFHSLLHETYPHVFPFSSSALALLTACDVCSGSYVQFCMYVQPSLWPDAFNTLCLSVACTSRLNVCDTHKWLAACMCMATHLAPVMSICPDVCWGAVYTALAVCMHCGTGDASLYCSPLSSHVASTGVPLGFSRATKS